MTPAARLAATIEVLDAIAAERAPADQCLKAWGRSHRFAGSGDRRAIAVRTYDILRARARLAWAMGAEDGRALVLGALAHLDGLAVDRIEALFSGDGHAPAALSDQERVRLIMPPADPPPHVLAGVPEFVAQALKRQFGEDWLAEAQALVQPRAPVDLRVNALCGGVEGALKLLAHEGIEAQRTPLSAWGLRLPPELAADVQKTRAYTTGWIEVQDEGSQLMAFLAGARPGQVVVDYCAGGGGKTLALAASMKSSDGRGSGRLIALDVNQRRLDAVPERLARAGAQAELQLIGPDGEGTEAFQAVADLVLVDAPCTGSGTWRRRPEGAWRVTPDDVARLAALQPQILARAAGLVKPGGRLVYVTCSVFAAENDGVAAAFAAAHPGFRPLSVASAAAAPALTDAARARLAELAGDGHTVQLTPRRTGTDGFFIALFERLP
ncbi:MAG TPA: RsmB/NOP family class I SAM-dependent RNA methyltransferase [Caulobacteraceae bacterium]|nr:RsmB/NOP family class I SAM-dependent RNA methyltransferase [Caulobacteraceae bacterium]